MRESRIIGIGDPEMGSPRAVLETVKGVAITCAQKLRDFLTLPLRYVAEGFAVNKAAGVAEGVLISLLPITFGAFARDNSVGVAVPVATAAGYLTSALILAVRPSEAELLERVSR